MTDTEELENLPSNSNAGKVGVVRPTKRAKRVKPVEVVEEPKKEVRQIAKAVRRKKTLTESIAETFVGPEGDGVGTYILRDVLLPAAKDTIRDMVTNGIEMILFGSPRSSGRSRDRGGSTRVSYGSFYRDRDERYERRREPVSRSRFNLDEIIFAHHDEAEDVLQEMLEHLEQYREISVADYLEMAGVDGGTWAAQKWGWTNLDRAYNTHTRGGWTLVLPKPIELE